MPDLLERVVRALARHDTDNVRRVRTAAFAALREGRAASPDELEAVTGLDGAQVRSALGELATSGRAELAADGSVVGSGGLSVRETRHRLVLDGVALHSWCALDAIGIPAATESRAVVRSACAFCGATVTIEIERGLPGGAEAVVASVPSDPCTNVRADFCAASNFYCSLEHLRSHLGADATAASLTQLAELGPQLWGPLAGREGSP